MARDCPVLRRSAYADRLVSQRQSIQFLAVASGPVWARIRRILKDLPTRAKVAVQQEDVYVDLHPDLELWTYRITYCDHTEKFDALSYVYRRKKRPFGRERER